MAFSSLIFCTILIFYFVIFTGASHQFKRICYFTNWSCDLLVPEAHFCLRHIDPTLCSHIIYGFANINVTSYSLSPSRVDDESSGSFLGRYILFNNIKRRYPHLKTMLSVGGSMKSNDFNAMTSSPTSRMRFAANSVEYVRKWGFDGLDLDWEYPGQDGGSKHALSFLVQDIRKADDSLRQKTSLSPLLLSVAGPASDHLVDKGFQVDIISKHVDFINVMAYDLQGSWSRITGFNSPLFPRKSDWRFHPNHCVEWVVRMWIAKGAPPSKLVLGIAGYGQSYTLAPRQRTTTTPTPPAAAIARPEVASYYQSDDVIVTPMRAPSNAAVSPIPVAGGERERTHSRLLMAATMGRRGDTDSSKGSERSASAAAAAEGVAPRGVVEMDAVAVVAVPGIGSPAIGPGNPGRLRHLNGQLSYPEICESINHGGHVSWDEEQRVPFMTLGDLWVGYDDRQSVIEKVRWAVDEKLGGVMFWSMDLDDFTGRYCNQGRYPLLRAMSDTVRSLVGIHDDRYDDIVNGEGDKDDGRINHNVYDSDKNSSSNRYYNNEISTPRLHRETAADVFPTKSGSSQSHDMNLNESEGRGGDEWIGYRKDTENDKIFKLSPPRTAGEEERVHYLEKERTVSTSGSILESEPKFNDDGHRLTYHQLTTDANYANNNNRNQYGRGQGHQPGSDSNFLETRVRDKSRSANVRENNAFNNNDNNNNDNKNNHYYGQTTTWTSNGETLMGHNNEDTYRYVTNQKDEDRKGTHSRPNNYDDITNDDVRRHSNNQPMSNSNSIMDNDKDNNSNNENDNDSDVSKRRQYQSDSELIRWLSQKQEQLDRRQQQQNHHQQQQQQQRERSKNTDREKNSHRSHSEPNRPFIGSNDDRDRVRGQRRDDGNEFRGHKGQDQRGTTKTTHAGNSSFDLDGTEFVIICSDEEEEEDDDDLYPRDQYKRRHDLSSSSSSTTARNHPRISSPSSSSSSSISSYRMAETDTPSVGYDNFGIDFDDNDYLNDVVNEYDYYIAFVDERFQSPSDTTTMSPSDSFTYARQSINGVKGRQSPGSRSSDYTATSTADTVDSTRRDQRTKIAQQEVKPMYVSSSGVSCLFVHSADMLLVVSVALLASGVRKISV